MDYIVIILDLDTERLIPIHFVSHFPSGTVGFFEDLYDRVLDYGYDEYSFVIREVSEGI
jgi:hypothetical protein